MLPVDSAAHKSQSELRTVRRSTSSTQVIVAISYTVCTTREHAWVFKLEVFETILTEERASNVFQ